MQFYDEISLGQAVEVTALRETRNGSLVVHARAARGGNVQDYLGAEVGRPDLGTVRVFRDADEIFHKDSLATFGHKPVTLDHPSGPVTSRTWRDVARGHTGEDILRDGEFVKIPMMVADQAAIDAVKGGKRELSVGYQCGLDWTAGTSPAGQAYDAKQVNIIVDHVAIVDRGRAGPNCRIGDGRPSDDEKTMRALSDTLQRDPPMKTHLIGDNAVEMSDAAIVAVKGLQTQLGTLTADNLQLTADKTALIADRKQAIEAKDGEILQLQADHAVAITAKDAEIAALKADALTADKLDAAVAERSAVLDAAKPILGAAYDAKGKTVADIRRATVAKRLGDKAVEGKIDEHVAIAFDTLAVVSPMAVDHVRQAVMQNGPTIVGDAGAAYEAMKARLSAQYLPQTA